MSNDLIHYRPVQGENILYPWTLDLDLTNFVTFLTALELRIGRHRFFSSIQKINFLVFKEVSSALGGSNKFHPQLTQTSIYGLKREALNCQALVIFASIPENLLKLFQ